MMQGTHTNSRLRFRIFGKDPVGAYLRLNRSVWKGLPQSITSTALVRSYGALLHRMVRIRASRDFNFGTHFLRNRPQLELIQRLAQEKGRKGTVRLAVLACSKGAEVYSILWKLRSVRPELKVEMQGIDISEEMLAIAKAGVYSSRPTGRREEALFDRISLEETGEMFTRDGDRLIIKEYLKGGVRWDIGDASDPGITKLCEPQDIVVASNLLCHMEPDIAEKCLRNIVRLVKPGGYVLVTGVDLEVRAKVAGDLGWEPVLDLLEETHQSDSLRRDWPWEYWGLEPLDKKRPDWRMRYASAFRTPAGT